MRYPTHLKRTPVPRLLTSPGFPFSQEWQKFVQFSPKLLTKLEHILRLVAPDRLQEIGGAATMWESMPYSNLNLQQLSRYLHLSDAQIRKLADKGAIPSRRVNGELVFARDDVHRWLEQRIGLSDEEELVQVEEALTKSVPPGTVETEVSLAALIPDGAIALPLKAKTKDSVIRSIVQVAGTTGLLWDTGAMAEAVKAREELHSTALDNGVALLHPRRPMPNLLGDTFLVLGIVPSGVPFGGASGWTDVFFLICAMDDRIHLRVLTRLSRVLTHPDFLKKLRESANESEIRELIAEFEFRL